MRQAAIACRFRKGMPAAVTFSLLSWVALSVGSVCADPTREMAEPVPRIFTLDEAVKWALQYNPELAALRQQHHIAAAGVLIARKYPFNPMWEGKTRAVTGPSSAGISNSVSNEHKLLLEIEIRGQRTHRRRAAGAALTRTDCEIAYQEVSLAVKVVRAFNNVLYRREKLRLVEETIKLNQQAAEEIRKLVEQKKLRAADLIVIRSDIEEARTQLGSARAAFATALSELRRALGLVREPCNVQGVLHAPDTREDVNTLTLIALEQRQDLLARSAAIKEADARLRLEIANRFGNPTFGADYEIDAGRVSNIGGQINLPIPVLNTRRGEILQRKAEKTRAALEFHQIVVVVKQDVQASLAHLKEARRGVDEYQKRALPNLQAGLGEMERFYAKGDPGVDIFRLIEFRRKVVKARDGLLDALFELTQAQSELAAAVGNPWLAISHPVKLVIKAPK